MRRIAVLLWISGALCLSGCLSPCCNLDSCTTGCGVDACDGYDACGNPPIPCTPFEHLRQARRSMICGTGCGEVYYGEWLSHPPDCTDPCDSCGEYIGGDGCKCFPFVRVQRFLGSLVGHRFRCENSPGLLDCVIAPCGVCEADPCCCEDTTPISDYYQGDAYESEFIEMDPSTGEVPPPKMNTTRGRSIKRSATRQPQPTVATPSISVRR